MPYGTELTWLESETAYLVTDNKQITEVNEMGLADAFKNFMGMGPEEEMYDDFGMPDMMSNENEEEQYKQSVNRNRKSKVVDIKASTQMKVVVIQPEEFSDVRTIADHLKTRKPVIINLELLERDDMRRVVDFLSGASYGLEGAIEKISNCIFLIAPNNVDILGGDGKDDFKGKGYSFGG